MANWNRRPPGKDILEFYLERGVRLESGCLVRPDCRNGPRDYPTVCNEAGKTVKLPRYVFERVYRRLSEGEQVLHRCDFPPCYEPAHLFAGTILDNMQDRREKGREARFPGELHPGAKLSREQAAEIKARYEVGGVRQEDLAQEFGIDQTTVSRIVRGAAWHFRDGRTVVTAS